MADDQKLIKEISKYSDQIGGFAGKYGNLVASCDGVGTKILLAQTAKNYHNRPLQSIGIDCVAMVVNDLLCKGAKPKFFLDYFAADRIREDEFYEILEGIHEGCVESEMELMGGETAELNGIITSDAFDVCGFGVGFIVDELPKDNIVVGDSVIGLKSSGFHSNGFTIIRQSLMDQNYMTTRSNEDMIDNFLEPTKIYVKDIDLIRESGIKIKALAHITGGGFKNVDRILPDNLKVEYKQSNGYYSHPHHFKWIQSRTNMSKEKMRSTFNCGIGMVIVLSPEEVEKMPVESIHLGEIV
jgi:phosphoribosylformylglycinamidine cyclo-ligase